MTVGATPSRSRIVRGALLGTATGASMALLYGWLVLILLASFILIGAVVNAPSWRDAGLAWMVAGAIPVCGFVFVLFFGVLPAAFLGLFTGIVLSLLLAPFGREAPSGAAATLGLTLGVLVVIAVHLVLAVTSVDGSFLELPPSTYFQYLLWFGVPGLIYIPTTGWMGWMLRR